MATDSTTELYRHLHLICRLHGYLVDMRHHGPWYFARCFESHQATGSN